MISFLLMKVQYQLLYCLLKQHNCYEGGWSKEEAGAPLAAHFIH